MHRNVQILLRVAIEERLTALLRSLSPLTRRCSATHPTENAPNAFGFSIPDGLYPVPRACPWVGFSGSVHPSGTGS